MFGRKQKITPPSADFDWKNAHANESNKAVEHELVEGVIEEFMDNIGVADRGLPAYGIRKVARYAAMVARAQALGFDPNALRMSGSEASEQQLELIRMAVAAGVPVHTIVPLNRTSEGPQ